MSPATIEIEPVLENVAVARHFVARRLRHGAIDPAVVGDIELAASELVTNAVEHGDLGRVQVAVDVTPAAVELSVTSHAQLDAVPPLTDWVVAASDAIAGRGLGIVHAIADDIFVMRGDGRLTITLSRRLA